RAPRSLSSVLHDRSAPVGGGVANEHHHDDAGYLAPSVGCGVRGNAGASGRRVDSDDVSDQARRKFMSAPTRPPPHRESRFPDSGKERQGSKLASILRKAS